MAIQKCTVLHSHSVTIAFPEWSENIPRAFPEYSDSDIKRVKSTASKANGVLRSGTWAIAGLPVSYNKRKNNLSHDFGISVSAI
jgi:hypothetical protein